MIPSSVSISHLQEIAQLVHRCFPTSSAAVAGGCLRDLMHGKPVSDIDVFISLGDEGQDPGDWIEEDSLFNEYKNGMRKLAESLYSTKKRVERKCEGGSDYSSSFIREVWEFPEGFRMYPLQLVFSSESPVDTVRDDFDFGICQAWTSGGRVQTTPAYKSDDAHRKFELMNQDTGRPTTWERLQKLRAKYPGWRFVGTVGIKEPLKLEVTAPPVGGWK